MSVSSLLRSARLTPSLLHLSRRVGASSLDKRTSTLAQGLLQPASLRAESLSSFTSSVSSRRSFSSSLGSLSSWIENERADKSEGADQSKDLVSEKETASVKRLAQPLPASLAARIETHTETGHKFVILKTSAGTSKFLFFANGDLSKRVCYSVYREDTGEPITSENDFRAMIKSFCFMQKDFVASWNTTATALSLRFRVPVKKICYNIVLIHFDSQTATAYSSSSGALQGFNQFKGTSLKISKTTKEKIKELLEERANRNSPNSK